MGRAEVSSGYTTRFVEALLHGVSLAGIRPIDLAHASTFRKFCNNPPAFVSQSERSRPYRISRATETGQPHDRIASASEQTTILFKFTDFQPDRAPWRQEPGWMWLIHPPHARNSRARRADVIRPSHALAHIQNRTTCEISSIGPGEGPALWLLRLRRRPVLTAVCQAMRLGLWRTIDAERFSGNARTITLPARDDRRCQHVGRVARTS